MFQHLSFSPSEDIIARTHWYIHFRWFFILTLAVPASLTTYLSDGWHEPLTILLSAAALALITNGAFYLAARFLRNLHHIQLLAVAMLLTDIIINSYVILTRGGVESLSVILYVIPIIMSAVIFGRKGIYSAAGLSLITYNCIVVADHLNIFRSGGGLSPALHSEPSLVLYIILFFNSALIAVAIATDFIVKLLRDKERQALRTIEDLKRAQAIGKFGSWEWDLTQDKIIWSDEMYHSLGLNREEILSFERYVGFVHSKDRRRLVSEIRKASRRPRHFGFDYRIVLSDGSERYMRSEGQSLPGRMGRIVTIIGTSRDVTEERLLDNTKNEFVSLASHQLRTPATVVKQYLNMLLDGYVGELTEEQRKFLKIASDTNEHEINIINNLLGVAQLESGKIKLTMAQVDLAAFIKGLVNEYAPRANTKSHSLTVSTRYKHLYSRADEHSLRTVLENILDNAFKYTMPGKSIAVRLAKEANTVVISVSDQGVGIAGHDQHKLFKKFSRIENPDTFQEEGAGLGLYWAEKIVTLHGGRITVDSELGKGTTVKIILPMKRSKKAGSSPRRPRTVIAR